MHVALVVALATSLIALLVAAPKGVTSRTALASLRSPAVALSAGLTRSVTVAGRNGVPDGDEPLTVALDVTLAQPDVPTELRVWPTGDEPPAEPSLRVVPGTTTTQLVLVEIGAEGRVDVALSDGSADVVIDLVAWFGPDAGLLASRSASLVDVGSAVRDQRSDIRSSPFRNDPDRRPSTITVDLGGGRAGERAFATGDHAAALVDVELVGGPDRQPGDLTLWPSGTTQPTSPNLRSVAGQRTSVLLPIALAASSLVDVDLSGAPAEATITVVGWIAHGSGLHPISPHRVLDATRDDVVRSPASPDQSGRGTVVDIDVAGRGGVPATGAGAVLLSVTMRPSAAPTFLTVWPSGLERPMTASATPLADRASTTTVLTMLGDGGRISIFDFDGNVEVDVDVVAWFSAASIGGRTPTRLFDSRRADNTSSVVEGGLAFCTDERRPVVDADSLNDALSAPLGDWIGADTGDEVVLPDGDLLILGGDTLVGEHDGQVVPRPYWFVSNSLVRVAPDGCVTTIWGRGDPLNPLDDTAWIEPSSDSHRLWPSAAWVSGDRLFVWVGEYAMDENGPPGWNFSFLGERLVSVAVDDLGLRAPTPVPLDITQVAADRGIELGVDAIVLGDSVVIAGRGVAADTSGQRFVVRLDADDPAGQAARWLAPDGTWGLEPQPLDWGPVGARLRIHDAGTDCWLATAPTFVFDASSVISQSPTLVGGWSETGAVALPVDPDADVDPSLDLRYYLHHLLQLPNRRWLLSASRNVAATRLDIGAPVPIEDYRPLYADVTAPSC